MLARARAVCPALLALALALPAGAQPINPVSYVAPGGECGAFCYFDDTGHQLTDGVLGADDWSANLGSGNAFEWVGWRTFDPTLHFVFAGPVTVGQVTVDFNRGQGAGIFLPSTVTIGGTSFPLAGTELPDGTRGPLTFTGSWTGSTLDIALADNHGGRWIFVDEVRFAGPAAAVVPEPATLGLLAGGLLGLGAVRRRRAR